MSHGSFTAGLGRGIYGQEDEARMRTWTPFEAVQPFALPIWSPACLLGMLRVPETM